MLFDVLNPNTNSNFSVTHSFLKISLDFLISCDWLKIIANLLQSGTQYFCNQWHKNGRECLVFTHLVVKNLFLFIFDTSSEAFRLPVCTLSHFSI